MADDESSDWTEDEFEDEQSAPGPGLSSYLAYSDLSSSEIVAFRDEWAALSDEERVALMVSLVELAESSIDVNFNRVFREVLDDPLPRIRQLALEGLWEDDGTDLVPILLSILSSDTNVDVRAEAASSLLRFTDDAEHAAGPDDSEILSALLRVIENERENALVRRRAIESIGPYAAIAEVAKIIRTAFRDDDQSIAAGAVGAMGYSYQSRWLPEIEEAMRHEDAEMRYVAAIAAGAIGDPDAVQSLARLVDDEDGEVRYSAIAALGHIGGQGALRVLTNLRERDGEGDELVEEAIQEALIQTDPLTN